MAPSFYLPEDAEARLKEYTYEGKDCSYIFKYFWVPVCSRFVSKLPPWIAPNVITVSALLFVCFTHAVVAYYMPKMTVETEYAYTRRELFNKSKGTNGSEGNVLQLMTYVKEMVTPPPPGVFVLCGVGLLMYQLLDNADGMQARRTGVTGPLGLLMDHGCDAFNCIIGSLTVCAMVGAGPTWKSWLIVMNTLLVFLFNTWEHYYRGALVLPTINGPNEGILIAVILYFWTAYVGGPQWWRNGAVEIPTRFLPDVLRQSAPKAAVEVEKIVLDRVCPLLGVGTFSSTKNGVDDQFATLPFILNMNCSSHYRADPPLPAQVLFNEDPKTARYEALVIGKQWLGQSPLQKVVLALYGTSEETIRIRYNTIAVAIMTALALSTMLEHTSQVYRALRRRSPEERLRLFGFRRFPFLQALLQLVPILFLALLAQVWFLTSQEDIFRRHPRIFCWTVGLLFTKLALHLMVAHLCSTPFRALRRTFVPFLLFGAHITLTFFHNVNKARRRHRLGGDNATTPPSIGIASLASTMTNASVSRIPANQSRALTASPVQAVALFYSDYAYDLDEELILYEFLAVSTVTFVHLVWSIARDISQILKVPLFTVPKEKQNALRAKIAAEKAEVAAKKKK